MSPAFGRITWKKNYLKKIYFFYFLQFHFQKSCVIQFVTFFFIPDCKPHGNVNTLEKSNQTVWNLSAKLSSNLCLWWWKINLVRQTPTAFRIEWFFVHWFLCDIYALWILPFRLNHWSNGKTKQQQPDTI